MPPFKPSAFARRILRKLASGGICRARDGGSYQIGATSLPAGLADEFVRQDLVEFSASGDLVLSMAGQAFVRRNLQKASGAPTPGNCREGDKYRRQHQVSQVAERVIDGKKREVQLNCAESPLNWLAQRKDRRGKPFLELEHVAAGERLRRDFTVAGMAPRLTPGYDGVPVNTGSRGAYLDLSATEIQLLARDRFNAAMAGVDPELSEILLRVCCYLEGLGEAERHLDWPARSGKVVLRIALGRLAGHYGLR